MLRFLCGLAMGLFTWIAADSADDDTRRGSIAAVGPLTSAVAAPLLAVAVNVGGLDAIYGTLAVVSVLCMLLPITVEAAISHGRRPIEAKGILPVLLGMAGLTLGGSAVFVFIGVIARDQIGMSTVTLSIALSLNAVAGIPTARYAGRRRFPGVFIMLTGCCAFLLTVADSTVMFMAIVTIWGMTFWLAVPETFALLSERSRHPADRIGSDAQAIMSMGRVIGPTVGGALVAAGSFTAARARSRRRDDRRRLGRHLRLDVAPLGRCRRRRPDVTTAGRDQRSGVRRMNSSASLKAITMRPRSTPLAICCCQ
ncbi:MAG: hypothetical protein R2710_00965 [Acidimicrobiales bacterium]